MSTATAMSVGELLAASAKPKATKSSKPAPFFLPDLQAKCDELASIIVQAKDLEARKDMLTADLIQSCEPVRVSESRKTGKCMSSLDVNGLTYVCQNRYSKIDKPGQMEAAKQALGSYVRDVYAVKIDVTKLTTELLQALLAAGATVEQHCEVTANFHAERTLKPEVEAMTASFPINPVRYFMIAKEK